jgi:hypothetical protein
MRGIKKLSEEELLARKARRNKEIAQLEARIQLGNFILKWLRSDDPMLTEPEWKDKVPVELERKTEEVAFLTAKCRELKILRDGNPEQKANVGLKSAKMAARNK